MVNKERFKTFFFGFLIILGCNSIDEISDNPDSNQETDTINNSPVPNGNSGTVTYSSDSAVIL